MALENRKLRMKTLTLSNVGRFKEFRMHFNDGVNYICGTNGIGKTTILEAISASFLRYWGHTLKPRVDSSGSGSVGLDVMFDGTQTKLGGKVVSTAYDQYSGVFPYNRGELHSGYLLYVKTKRDFSYVKSQHIAADPTIQESNFDQSNMNGVSSAEVKQWFSNRWLFEAHSQSWPQHQIDNLSVSKRVFSVIDANVSLSHVDTATFDILVRTPSGVLPYEFLSSGYRAIYAIILGLIKEIEYRGFKVAASEFQGTILIDEIDLHLHPTWQQQVGRVLKDIFPKAQIIATTHSPHIIQSAETNEVVALVDGDDGPVRNNVGIGPYGFKGWTIEEILTDVMGLETTLSSEYKEALSRFEAAIGKEDTYETNEAFRALDAMLHPESHIRKLLRIQAAGILGQ